jgi:hypothetical protein
MAPRNPVGFGSPRVQADPSATAFAGPPADASGNILYPTASILEKLAAAVSSPAPAPRDLSVEVVGPPPPAGSISFDHVCSVKGLGFVEGVALIQTVCERYRRREGQGAYRNCTVSF